MSDYVHNTELSTREEVENGYELDFDVTALVYTDDAGNEYVLQGIGWVAANLAEDETEDDAKKLVSVQGAAAASVFGFTFTDRTVTLKKGTTWRNDILKENPNFDPDDLLSLIFGDGEPSHYQAMKI